MVKGFTTGIDDEDIPEEAKKQIADVLVEAIHKVGDLVRYTVMEPLNNCQEGHLKRP